MASITLPMPSAPMTSVTDMLSGVGDIFAGASDIPEPVSEDAPVDDAPVEDAPVEDALIGDEPAGADEPIGDGASEGAEDITAAATPDVTPAAAATPEELPDGITKGKDSKGRTKYFLDENRYKTVYGNHQLVQEATELLGGEALTMEKLEHLNASYMAQEKLFTDLTSGDPNSQGELVDFMIGEMQGALANGETGVDPTIPFAQKIYSSLRDKAPDAYAELRLQAARDFIGEMFDLAAKSGDDALGASMGHVARALVGLGPKPADMTPEQYLAQVRELTSGSQLPFYTPTEVKGLAKGEDPLVAANRRIQQLESQANGTPAGDVSAERFKTWNQGHIADVNKGIFDNAITPALSSVADSWKEFPADYQRLVLDPLNREVMKAVNSDTALNQQAAALRTQAKRATSEQVRTQIGNQIKQLFVNRARLAADKAALPILKPAAEWLAFKSQQTHGRRAAAQTRTAPQGQGSPVRRSVLPEAPAFKNGMYDSKTAMRHAMSVLNNR